MKNPTKNLLRKSRLFAVILAAICLLLIAGCSGGGNGGDDASGGTPTGQVDFSFDYSKHGGGGYDQYAVWIEDAAGNYVKTLFVTNFTLANFQRRPESVPIWVAAAGLAAEKKADVDAVTGATPPTGPVNYSWDFTDFNGNTVPAGEYVYKVEGTIYFADRVLFTGNISVGSEVTVGEATATYTTDAANTQTLISNLTAVYR